MSPKNSITFSIHGSDGVLLRTETHEREIIKIGRLASCQLRIADENAARVHAVIELAGAQTTLIDLGSEAGTIVNGQRVDTHVLRSGDRIQIGGTLVVVTGLQVAASGGGAEGGIRRAGPARTACPRCRQPLVARVESAVRVDLCQTCGGLWLDRLALHQIVQLPDAARAIRAIAADAASRSPFGGMEGRYNVACPICGALMERRKHRRTGVVIDLCARHGTWFDRGEPQRMLDGAGVGGSPFRSAPVSEEPTELLPELRAPAWMRDHDAPPEQRSPLVAQLVDLLFDLF